jgi:transposase-like protein
MITNVKTYTCPRCGSANLVKNGRNRYGNQQYLCKDCRKSGVLDPYNRYTEERKQQILAAYRARPNMSKIARKYGISRTTLSNWLKKRPGYARSERIFDASPGE